MRLTSLRNREGITTIMINFKYEIAKEIAKTAELDENELVQYVEIPPNTDLGDYAFPCFKLAKELRKPPQVIAEEIKNNVGVACYATRAA
ncbi:MAG: hypothetical protein FWC53_03960 [Firmicutes bacterium]|nr:hypothetical protein [Bacillota bacterium]